MTTERWGGLSLILAAICWTLFVADVASRGWVAMIPSRNDLETQVALFLLTSLAVVLALLGLTGVWFHQGRREHGTIVGEISLVVTLIACLLFMVGYAIFIGQDFDTAAAAYTAMNLGLMLFVVSMLLHGLTTTVGRVLPARSTVPLILSPIMLALLPVLLAMHQEDTAVPAHAIAAGLVLALSLSVSWLLLGYALLRLPSPPAARPTSRPGSGSGTEVLD